MVVGVTGGIGSGKSFVVQCFLGFENVHYYHADLEAKKLMNTSDEIKEKIIAEFGSESYKDDELNRPYISSIVFNNPKRLQKLNSIVHPAVRNHFQDYIKKQSKTSIIVYENAILFEAKSDQFCDVIITVLAPLETRIQRVISRDQVDRAEVLKRMKNQWSDHKKILLSNYIILNINKEETLLKVQDIYNFLTKKSYLF